MDCPKCGVDMWIMGGVGKGAQYACPECKHLGPLLEYSTDQPYGSKRGLVPNAEGLPCVRGTGQAPAEAPESGGRAEVLAWLKRGAPGLSGTIGGMSTPDVRMADAAAALIERDGERESALRECLAKLGGYEDVLRELVEAVNEIRNNSQGVTGWHLNGDLAEWDEYEFLTVALTSAEAALDTKEAE